MLSKRFYVNRTDWGAELCDDGEVIMSSYHQDVFEDIVDLLNKQDDLITKLYGEIGEYKRDCKKIAMIKGIFEEFTENGDVYDAIDVCISVEKVLDM